MNNKLPIILPVLFVLASCGGASDSQNDISADVSGLPTVEDALTKTDSAFSSTADMIEAELESRKEYQEIQDKVKKAQAMLDEANGLEIADQKERVATIISEVNKVADELAENDDFFVVADDLKRGTEELESILSSFVDLPSLPTFIDLAAAFQNTNIKALSRDGTNIYAISDRGVYGPLNSGNIDQVKEIALPDGKSAYDGAYSLKFSSLMVTATPASVFALGTDSFVEQKVKDNQPWLPMVNLHAYGNNLYAWDPINNSFIKYGNVGSGTYDAPSSALPEAATSGKVLTGIAIDGAIYTLALNDGIRKYVNGSEIDLEIDRPFTSSNLNTKLYSDQNSSYLYVFDPDNKKLLRYRKAASSLHIDKEWTLDRPYSTMFVAPGDRAIYFSEGSSVFKLDL